MSSVKPTYIRRAAEDIYYLFPDKVSNIYSINKMLVESVTKGASKTDRNKIAGYLVRLYNKKRKVIDSPHKKINME